MAESMRDFWCGVGSVLELFPTTCVHSRRRQIIRSRFSKTAEEALKADWVKIGIDFKSTLSKIDVIVTSSPNDRPSSSVNSACPIDTASEPVSARR